METIRYIHYLYKVYELRSFSKAAEALYISQPSLSAVVKKVETETGFPIFDRSRSPIGLTPEGEVYIEAVKRILSVEQKLEEYVAEYNSGRRGSITVGGSSYFCAYVLLSIISDYKALYPNSNVVTFEANAGDMLEGLKQGAIDLGVSVDRQEMEGFASKVWKSEHLLFAVPAQYEVNKRLAKYRLSWQNVTSDEFLSEKHPAVSIGLFADLPYLSLRRGSDLYARGKEIFGRGGCKPNVVMHLDSMLTSFYVAKEGKGCCFMRSDMLKYSPETDSMCFYKIDDPLTTRNIYLYYRPDSPRLPNVKRFLDFLEQNK